MKGRETEDCNEIEKNTRRGSAETRTENERGKSGKGEKYIALAYCARGLPRIMRD